MFLLEFFPGRIVALAIEAKVETGFTVKDGCAGDMIAEEMVFNFLLITRELQG